MKTMNDARCLARIIRPGLCRGVSVRACLALLAFALAFAQQPLHGGAGPAGVVLGDAQHPGDLVGGLERHAGDVGGEAVGVAA